MTLLDSAKALGMEELAIAYGWSAIRRGSELLAEWRKTRE
jgi:hypothetical protein